MTKKKQPVSKPSVSVDPLPIQTSLDRRLRDVGLALGQLREEVLQVADLSEDKEEDNSDELARIGLQVAQELEDCKVMVRQLTTLGVDNQVVSAMSLTSDDVKDFRDLTRLLTNAVATLYSSKKSLILTVTELRAKYGHLNEKYLEEVRVAEEERLKDEEARTSETLGSLNAILVTAGRDHKTTVGEALSSVSGLFLELRKELAEAAAAAALLPAPPEEVTTADFLLRLMEDSSLNPTSSFAVTAGTDKKGNKVYQYNNIMAMEPYDLIVRQSLMVLLGSLKNVKVVLV